MYNIHKLTQQLALPHTHTLTQLPCVPTGGWKSRGEHGAEEGCTAGEKDAKGKGDPAEEDAAGS